MSRRGDCWDNSAMESFFSTLKIERTIVGAIGRAIKARADVFDFIERFYNPQRRHSTIGYITLRRQRPEADVVVTKNR